MKAVGIQDKIRRIALGLRVASGHEGDYGWGLSDWHDIRFLLRNVERPAVFDIGANIGHTALACRRGLPKASIYSFEPVPETFEVLKSRTPFAHPQCLAMGAEAGVVRMKVCSDNLVLSKVVEAEGDIGGSTIEVEVSTVDDQLESPGVDVLDVLKVDVEGYELSVFAGAAKVMRSGRIRAVLVECRMVQDGNPMHTYIGDIMGALPGYRLVSVYTRAVDPCHGINHADALIVHPTLLSSLPAFCPSPE